MSGVNIPQDSTHLSDLTVAEMVDQYSQEVDSQFNISSMMRSWVKVRNIVGTDTVFNRRVGRTKLKTVQAGVRPAADATGFGRTSLTIDTIVLARDNQSLLNDFQADFAVRQELGMDHGKELGKLYDESLLIAGIKGAAASAPTGLNGAFGAGITTTLGSVGDEDDPDALYTAVSQGITAMKLKDMETSQCVIFVNPTQYDVLLNNDKLVNRDFTKDGGGFSDGVFKTIKGVPVIETNRLPTAANSAHELSTAANGNFYNTTAAEARTAALIMHPSALLVGETIPLTSKVYYEDTELQWFIDSYIAFGATYNRPDGSVAIQAIV